MPLKPEHLNYANCQFLFIGEGSGEMGKAVEATAKDQKHNKETPREEIEQLEHEDEHRTEAVKGWHPLMQSIPPANLSEGDDTIFLDLGISHKEYPKVKTTW